MSQPIDLVKFLFLADVDINQAEYILDNFSNFTMPTYEAFFDFFKNNGITLNRYRQRTTDERVELIEKFKAFKQSYEYEIIKKYIAEEKELELLLNTQDPNVIKQALTGSVLQYSLDAFDYYIVRKVLTGTEYGVLPSERLKETLSQITTVTDSYPMDGELFRDEEQRVISYENILRNSGKILVPIQDDRYIKSRFEYVLQRNFESLPDAVNADRNILKRFADANLNSTTAQQDIQQFLSDLKNLQLTMPNSVASLEAQVSRLTEIIQAKQELIDSMVSSEIEHEAFIDSIAMDNINKEQEIENKDESIANLQETIDKTLDELSKNVAEQMNVMTASIDTLAGNIINQSNSANSAQDKLIASLNAQITSLKSEKDSLEKIINNLIQKNNLKT
jgi:hypothetical protein